MRSGFLVYKCRKCGKLLKHIHVPNGMKQVCDAVSKKDSTSLLSVCNCKGGDFGIADLIGFKED